MLDLQATILLARMKQLIRLGYEYNGHFPYELYTSMCTSADEIGVKDYTLDMHDILLRLT